jgi:hypothetical protein
MLHGYKKKAAGGATSLNFHYLGKLGGQKPAFPVQTICSQLFSGLLFGPGFEFLLNRPHCLTLKHPG